MHASSHAADAAHHAALRHIGRKDEGLAVGFVCVSTVRSVGDQISAVGCAAGDLGWVLVMLLFLAMLMRGLVGAALKYSEGLGLHSFLQALEEDW